MKKRAVDFWERALDSFGVAEREKTSSPDNSAACSYYAAFNSISAVITLSGKEVNSHDGAEILLHRELIKPGILSAEIGKHYKTLRDARRIGSYGGGIHIQPEESAEYLRLAKKIIEAVYSLHPDEFSRPGWMIARS